MGTLIETLLAFVGTMLVFALAAQSVQELLKTMLVIKGRTMLTAVEGLVREATKANRQWTIDADAILKQVVKRLGSLGQAGFREGAIRLDALPADQLESLIAKVEPADVPGLPGEVDAARKILETIGKQAKEWYPIAMNPVDDRYRRRMRVLALLSSALVVLPFNLDAIRVFKLAETNNEFRTQVTALAVRLDSLHPPKADSAKAPAETAGGASAGTTAVTPPESTPPSTAPATGSQADSAHGVATLSPDEMKEIRRVFSQDLLGQPSLADLKRPRWWLGILLSIVMVSLGAPFWHDLLESLFGLKNRLGSVVATAGGSETKADKKGE